MRGQRSNDYGIRLHEYTRRYRDTPRLSIRSYNASELTARFDGADPPPDPFRRQHHPFPLNESTIRAFPPKSRRVESMTKQSSLLLKKLKQPNYLITMTSSNRYYKTFHFFCPLVEFLAKELLPVSAHNHLRMFDHTHSYSIGAWGGTAIRAGRHHQTDATLPFASPRS